MKNKSIKMQNQIKFKGNSLNHFINRMSYLLNTKIVKPEVIKNLS